MRSIILVVVVCVALTAVRDCVECRTIGSFDSKIVRSLLPFDQDTRVIGENLLRTKRHTIKKFGNGCPKNNKRLGVMCLSESRPKYGGKIPKVKTIKLKN